MTDCIDTATDLLRLAMVGDDWPAQVAAYVNRRRERGDGTGPMDQPVTAVARHDPDYDGPGVLHHPHVEMFSEHDGIPCPGTRVDTCGELRAWMDGAVWGDCIHGTVSQNLTVKPVPWNLGIEVIDRWRQDSGDLPVGKGSPCLRQWRGGCQLEQ